MKKEITPKKLKDLMQQINHQFTNTNLLKIALTHRSATFQKDFRMTDNKTNHSPYGSINNQNYERLEFLGDAVLDLAISTILMQKYDLLNEGELSKIRAALVNEKILASIARRINLGSYVLLGKGEELSRGRDKDSILADSLEALLGAIYLESGFETSTKIISKLFDSQLKENPRNYLTIDYKTNLQEIAQQLWHEAPVYTLISQSGPDHNKTFTIDISLQGKSISQGEGKSKKEAAQIAAKEALNVIRNLDAPDSTFGEEPVTNQFTNKEL